MTTPESDQQYKLQENQYARQGAYHRERLGQASALGTETRAKLTLTADLLQRQAPRFVVDLGCGEGVLMEELYSRGIPAYGVDSSDAATNLMPPALRRNTIKGDISRLPMPAGSVPAASMIAVLEHIPPDNVPGILEETYRILEDGGLFVVRVPSERQPMRDKHYRHFTPDSLIRVLEQGGRFTVEEMVGNHDVRFNWENIYGQIAEEALRKGLSDEDIAGRAAEVYAARLRICDPYQAKRLLAVCRKN